MAGTSSEESLVSFHRRNSIPRLTMWCHYYWRCQGTKALASLAGGRCQARNKSNEDFKFNSTELVAVCHAQFKASDRTNKEGPMRGPMVSYVGLVQTLCTSNIDHHRHFELDYSPVAPQNLSARALFELDYSPVNLDTCPSGINM